MDLLSHRCLTCLNLQTFEFDSVVSALVMLVYNDTTNEWLKV